MDTHRRSNGLSLEALEGRWRVVYSEVGGEMTPVGDFASIVLENRGDQFFVEKNGERVHEGTFTLDGSTSPYQIVYNYAKGYDIFLGGPRRGICQLAGDTLKTCFAPVGKEPPEDFSTSPESDAVLSVHQRVGAERGTGFALSKNRDSSQW